MSPEERAKAIALLAFDSDAVTSMIASAIRQAEASARNEALEEAATRAGYPGFIEARDTEWDNGVNFAKPFIASAIRSLKTKD